MPAPRLITYGDAIQRLVQWADALPQEEEQDRARGAVQEAYRTTCLDYPWRYFTALRRIQIQNSYATGTIEYSGSSQRRVTLTDGAWPSWVRYGHITFSGDNNLYKVAEQDADDSSIITLEEGFAPTSSIDAGTSYSLHQSTYLIPGDILSIEEIHDEQGQWSTSYVEPNDWLRLDRHISQTGRPWAWTIIGSNDAYAQFELCIHGRPGTSSAQTFDFLGQRLPGRLKYDGIDLYSSQGDYSVSAASAGSATCTLTGGISLPTDVVGSVLRLGMPGVTSPPGGIGNRNPYSEQRIITSRDSTTKVTVGSGWEFGTDDQGQFTLSDPIDLPSYLLEMFFRGCELEMAIANYPARVPQCETLYRAARIRARAQNNRAVPQPGSWRGWSHPAMALQGPWELITGDITQY